MTKTLSIDSAFSMKKPVIILHSGGAAPLRPDPHPEQQRHADVECRQLQAFRDAEFAVLLVQDAEVEGGQHDDDGQERGPEPDGRAEPVGGEELRHGPPRYAPPASAERRAAARSQPIAATSDPLSTPSRTLSNNAGSVNARLPMNRLMVKPIAASNDMPWIIRQFTCSGKVASRIFTASQAKPKMPHLLTDEQTKCDAERQRLKQRGRLQSAERQAGISETEDGNHEKGHPRVQGVFHSFQRPLAIARHGRDAERRRNAS